MELKAVILAAGKGTRLQTEGCDLPKVMREALGRPLIQYVLDALDFVGKENTMKKKTSIIIFAAVFLIGGILLYLHINRIKILSESSSQIQEIRVEFFDEETGTIAQRSTISDSDAINDFANIIAKGKRKVRKHPSHNDSIQCDFFAEIEIQYFNGDIDQLFLTKYALYRMLETKGGSGDPGYVSLENEDIYEFFETYKK